MQGLGEFVVMILISCTISAQECQEEMILFMSIPSRCGGCFNPDCIDFSMCPPYCCYLTGTSAIMIS